MRSAYFLSSFTVLVIIVFDFLVVARRLPIPNAPKIVSSSKDEPPVEDEDKNIPSFDERKVGFKPFGLDDESNIGLYPFEYDYEDADFGKDRFKPGRIPEKQPDNSLDEKEAADEDRKLPKQPGFDDDDIDKPEEHDSGNEDTDKPKSNIPEEDFNEKGIDKIPEKPDEDESFDSEEKPIDVDDELDVKHTNEDEDKDSSKPENDKDADEDVHKDNENPHENSNNDDDGESDHEDDEASEEKDHEEIPDDDETSKEDNGEEIPDVDEAVAESAKGGFIFETPFFNVRQVSKYFQQLEKALEHVFRQSLDEAALLNGTFANTTEEEVEIDGKKFIVHKSVIKGKDNNSSIYVEALSTIPKSNETTEEENAGL